MHQGVAACQGGEQRGRPTDRLASAPQQQLARRWGGLAPPQQRAARRLVSSPYRHKRGQVKAPLLATWQALAQQQVAAARHRQNRSP